MKKTAQFKSLLLVIAFISVTLTSCCVGYPMAHRPYNNNYRPIYSMRPMYPMHPPAVYHNSFPRPHPHYMNHYGGGGGHPRR